MHFIGSRRTVHACAAALLCALAAACGERAAPGDTPPGEAKSASTKALEAGAAVLQSKGPVGRLDTYLDGFHFASGDLAEQMEAHHYCAKLNEDLMQCALFDSNEKGALLIGVEYIVSERLFNTLPDDERKLWHSHVYEVKSGTLIAPGIPDSAEHALMAQTVNTYGKTWHTWNSKGGTATPPLGLPHLMLGFTGDGQLRPELLQQRDGRAGVSSQAKRQQRADLPTPAIAPGADAWMNGQATVLRAEQKAMENIR